MNLSIGENSVFRDYNILLSVTEALLSKLFRRSNQRLTSPSGTRPPFSKNKALISMEVELVVRLRL